jgi:membrane-bound lytic murein transglycosylase A
MRLKLYRPGQGIACLLCYLLLGGCSTAGLPNHTTGHDLRTAAAASQNLSANEPNADSININTLPDAPVMSVSYRNPIFDAVTDLPEALDYAPAGDRSGVDELETAPEWTLTPEDLPPPPQELPPADQDTSTPAAYAWVDDMDRASLKDAIRKQLSVMESGDLDRRVRLGPRVVSRRQLVDTLHAFMELLEQDLSDEAFTLSLNHQFEVISAKAPHSRGRGLFTGYYTPIIPARRQKDGKYIYPLYRKPEWYPAAAEASRYPRIANIDPSYHLTPVSKPVLLTREDIDGGHALRDQDLEVAWLKDDLERYFLHIQGSGYLAFPDGSLQAVQYMGSNLFRYRSVGRQMIRDGIITPGQGSMQGMKQYFRDHPENIDLYLFRNNRYIFFQMSDHPPRGSGGAELVAGRSIATDKNLYAAGGLAYITMEKPILNDALEITDWQKVSRFVVDQDTGAAIQGPGRVDLYFGVGERAGAAAGRYKRSGTLAYLLKK